MLTLDKILRDTIWVVKVGGCRFSGKYRDVEGYFDDPDFRDADIACTEHQPEELQEFYESYFNQREYFFVKDYYNNVYINLKKEN